MLGGVLAGGFTANRGSRPEAVFLEILETPLHGDFVAAGLGSRRL